MRLYAESSAVLAWLLGEARGDEVRELLAGAEAVVTSVLTLVEVERVLIRALVIDALTEGDVIDRRRILGQASRRWHMTQVHEEIVARARRPFPDEPIRTLDALHLASALTVRAAMTDLGVLSLDEAIRKTSASLGFDLLPGDTH